MTVLMERGAVDGEAHRAPRCCDLIQFGDSVLSDHANPPFSICAHWNDDDADQDQNVTTASMVWEPAEGRANVACGQPWSSPHVTYEL